MKRLLIALLVIPVALGVAVFAKAGPSSADFTCNDSGGNCGSSGSGTGPDCSASDPYLTVPNRLYGVAGSSTGDVWAVGLEPHSSLIMHWDGNCWKVSYDQPVGYFAGVSALSASDAWAVGGTSWWNPSHTLAEHWDGTSWTQVDTPNQGGSALFNGVAATSATNAWAVGMIGPGPGVPVSAAEPLIEHWDGTSWSAQSFAVPTDGGTFMSVAAISASNAWAVGWTGGVSEGTGQTTLIEHWDGSSWTRVSSPDPAGQGDSLDGVTIVSANDVWAVGYTATDSGVDKPLTMHWDGSSWSVVTSPDPAGDSTLRAVSAASANDVWAVGQTTQCGHGGSSCTTVAMHWDGSNWTTVSAVNPPSSYLNAFLGVTAISGGDVWAVGTTDYGSTLIEHWDGSSWRN